VAFLPDGQTLVTTDDDAAKFWDPATGQERITLKNINRVGVVSDGKTMALAATDGTVRFWHGAEDSEAQAYKSEFARDKALDPLVQVHAGDHLHASGRHEESAQSYRQALSRLEKLAAQNPQVAEYRAEQAYVYFALSLVLRAAGRSEEADQNQRKGLVIHRNLAAVHPDAPDLQSTPLDRLNELQWLLSTPAEADRRVKEFAQLVLAIHDAVPAAAVGKRNGLVLNSLAWRLVTGKDPRARDPQRAVALAKKAVELDPENAAYANTLGVALYRSADWQAAIAALEKSLEVRNGGDSFDWFILAMAHWRLGEKEEACQWFEQAALWMAKNNPDNEELKRFRDEAADLLRDEFKGLLETIEKTCRAEALAHSKRGNTQEKLAARRQAIDLLNELLAAGADAVRIRGMLAATLQSMGELQAGLEEFSDAESSLNDALRIRTELQGEQGDAPATLLDAVSTKVALGQLYWVSDRRSLAQTTWQECLSVLDQLAAASRTDARLLQARIAERPSAALFRQWLENQWAEADWQQRVQQAGDDPTPWIQRGRWRAERGEHEKADADFAKAASLTPNELNKFLESGWWVVGPYPQKLKEFCPPEIEPDPSQPVYVIDPQTGISDEPVRWQTLSASESVAGAQDGAVDLSEFFARNGGGSVYALGYVFSPDERSVTLFLNKNWPCRVWVNGAPTEAASADAVGWLTWTRVPVVLRPGRNTILVKTASQQFMALLSDEPAARAWELFKFGNFDRAAETYARVLQSPAHQWIVRHACFAALVAGDQEAYREFSKRLPSRSNAGLDAELGLLDAEVYANTEVPKADLPRLKSILERWYANPNRKREPWFERMSASSHYRLGEFDKVVAILKDFPNESHASPLLAMAYHRLGQKDQARKWLSRADALVDRSLKDFAGNGEGGLWLIYPTYREAVELIRGDAIELDARFHAFLAERQRLWETRDPLICAFDDGVRNAANDPHAYLARGKRLAELGRFDEAEADFNKAVELAPDDVETLAARARFQAQRGDAVKAQAEFAALLALATSRRDLLVTRFVEREIGQCETVLEYWRQREPTTAALGRIRAERLLRRGEWREAAAAFEETAEHAFREQFAAALYCLLNDRKAYEEACSRHAALAAANDPAAHEYGRLFILALWPGAPLEELTQLMEDRLPVEGEPFWRRFPVALAFYRHARYADAERELTQSLAGPAGWQAKARFWAVLAMTCWRTGRPAEARQWLRLCDWWTDFHRPGAEIPNDIAPYVNAHFEWLATHILYREAKALIEPRSPEESSPAPVHGPGPATPSIGP
jgi:tetratricopeptide (TPR) repeat protein